jgi:hypothetical protein
MYHVERKGDDDWVQKDGEMDSRPRGSRPRKTWMKIFEDEKMERMQRQTFTQRKDPWCETTNTGKPGHTSVGSTI